MEFKRIKAIREDNDLTQTEIARILGVNRGAYSLWELGINTIPLSYLNVFCNKFELSLDYILGITNVKNYTLVNNDIDINAVLNNLVSSYLTKFHLEDLQRKNLTVDYAASKLFKLTSAKREMKVLTKRLEGCTKTIDYIYKL